MAYDRGLPNSPIPLGGAALRQALRREQPLFPRPVPAADTTTPGQWTQFSGMPNQPGSPTSLHEWLQTVDDSLPSADNSPGVRGFPISSSSAASSRNSPMDSFTAADFLSSGICPERRMNSPTANMGQHFSFSSPHGFESSPDFGTPADFGSLHSSQFTHSPANHMSPLSADMSGLPPADFSQPPPDFSFQPHADFSLPPPSFLADLPPLSPTADPHQNFSDFLVTHSSSSYFPREAAVCEGHPVSSPSMFDATSLPNQPMPRRHGSMSGHVDVSLPPPSFGAGFSNVGDDIIFQDPVDMETPSQNSVPMFDRVAPPQRRIHRQNSEPVYSGTAADEGKAIYVDALRLINSFGPTYEPFGSASPPNEPEPIHSHIPVCDPPANTSKPVKAKEPSRKEPSRPSYSDVAKANKGKPSHQQTETIGIQKIEAENVTKTNTEPLQSKTHRPPNTRRSFTHTRIIDQRSKPNLSEGNHNSYVQPNSRYGLDQFEDLSDIVGAEHRSSSVESLNSQLHHGIMRRSSNSSISSGTSAVEENHGSRLSATSSAAGMDTMGSSYHMSGKDIPQNKVYVNSPACSPDMNEKTPHKSAPNPSSPAAQTLKNEKLFFDPKRIFQGKTGSKTQANLAEKSKNSEEKGRNDKESSSKEETVLNNGKPNNTSSKASAASHRKADYINNDLREGSSTSATSSSSGGSKRTNQTAAFNRHGHGSRKNSSKDSMPQNGPGADRTRGGDIRGRRQERENEEDNSFIRNIDWVLVDEWMKYISDCSMTFARNSFSAIITLVVYVLGFIMYLVMGAIHFIAVGISKVWTMVRSKIFKDQASSGAWTGFSAASETARKRFGVEENITLPATGEEAMKRLLACKGKDPYSILGLRADVSDEEIKRYYRRQAVLVHPDKNQEPGAEEAFKILGHAFEMIGNTTKRKEYDAHIFEASEAEAAMREFSDLLTKLQEKVQEAANMMRCDHCGGKHRRIPVDRAWYSARYCDRCNIHHSAKEGDVWAESSMLGFLWHYYACMDNNIYDITEWVSCQRDHFKHMKANAHPVFYRIQTDSNRRHRQGQSGEADLEDFINRLFNKASMSPDGASHSGWQFPSQQPGAGSSQSNWGTSAPSASASTSSSKRSRRKKKRN
ncbi:hypothetical protein ACOMHN_017654 [Nucella lapillus]